MDFGYAGFRFVVDTPAISAILLTIHDQTNPQTRKRALMPLLMTRKCQARLPEMAFV